MKRFHVHLHVDDLTASIAFYSRLFGTAPTRSEADYAKWMLDDPRLNFAISTRGAQPGIDHLGIQAETDEELAQLRASGERAGAPLLDEGQTTCCYARSEKHWHTDPQGIAWEHFKTLENIPVFREAPTAQTAKVADSACCAPAPRGKPLGIPVKSGSSCC
jgi:lactoylglutathione lyase